VHAEDAQRHEPEPPTAAVPSVLQLNPVDNVVVATADIDAGTSVRLPDGRELRVSDPVPAGHKASVRDIPKSTPVIKFGVHIGTATQDIPPGSHVHVHNVESERMRGDRG
jgi:altronate dehydratase